MACLVEAASAAVVIHDIETGKAFQGAAQDPSQKQWYQKLGTVVLLALVVGAASIVFNVLAMVFHGTAVIYVMAIIAVLLAPVVMKRQIDMDDAGGMRNLQNQLRENVNGLSSENGKLCGQVNEFAVQVEKLKHFETELGKIANTSTQDVDSLAKLVKENGTIVTKIKNALLAQAVNLVIETFLESDKDESNQLEEKEIQMLIFRLGQLEGMKVNNELFQQKLAEDSSMSGTIAVLRTSLKPGVKPKDKVFTFAIDP